MEKFLNECKHCITLLFNICVAIIVNVIEKGID